eukprot:CAMPEP_0177690038 /NCGR_PEP_ID=MMETSP0484_2-20121128/533_1 /TAXON_ID=354590 /ORGANISM="Rhodomonas lens, Strain RHODO" /LENGTH=428 /DNA_ID=CAMNT_0019200515 /DNA_START=6 /DNA_END=1289 /DNA_ORIENTATION=-
MGLNPNEAPWDGLAWPLALDETLECDGTRFCFRKGERDTYDCNTDNECLRDGAGTRCNSDCGWDSDSFLELGGADCCDYDPGFTDSARHDALLVASPEKVSSCESTASCGNLCSQLEGGVCGVVTEDGYLVCYPDLFPADGKEIFYPTLDMGSDAWFPDPGEVFFKLRPVVSMGLQGVGNCTQGSAAPSFDVTVDAHVVMAYVTSRSRGCRQTSNDYLSWLNKGMLVDENLQWGWTGQWAEGGGDSTTVTVGCAIEKTITKSISVSEGSSESVVLRCLEVFSEDVCKGMHMNDGYLDDTDVDDFALKLGWNVRKAAAPKNALLVTLDVQMCIEQSAGTCEDKWSYSFSTLTDVEFPTDTAQPCAVASESKENLCGLEIRGGAAEDWAGVGAAALSALPQPGCRVACPPPVMLPPAVALSEEDDGRRLD